MKILSIFLSVFYTLGLCFNLSSNTVNVRLNKQQTCLRLSNNIYHNSESYTNKNIIVSNISSNIDKIFFTYNQNHTLILYKNGEIHVVINKALKLKPEQDDIELHMVSNLYFHKLCQKYNITKS